LKSSTSDLDQKDFKPQELKYKYLCIFMQDDVLCISAVIIHKLTQMHTIDTTNFQCYYPCKTKQFLSLPLLVSYNTYWSLVWKTRTPQIFKIISGINSPNPIF